MPQPINNGDLDAMAAQIYGGVGNVPQGNAAVIKQPIAVATPPQDDFLQLINARANGADVAPQTQTAPVQDDDFLNMINSRAAGKDVTPQPTPQQPVASAEQPSMFERMMQPYVNLGAGLVKGTGDVVNTGIQGIGWAQDKLLGTNSRAAIDAAVKGTENEFNADYGNSDIAGIGRVAGNIMATTLVPEARLSQGATLAGRMLNAAGSGAKFNVMTASNSDNSLGMQAAMGAAGGAAAQPIGEVIGKGLKLIGQRAGLLPKNAKTVSGITSDDIRAQASALYQTAEAKGGSLSTDFANKFINKAESILPADAKAAQMKIYAPLREAIDDIKVFKDEPMSLERAQLLDEALGNYVDKFTENGRVSKEGQKILNIQSDFRDMIEKAAPDDIIGGKEGFDALKQGRQAWSQALRLRDVERIVQRAELMDNPVTGIKTGFRTLLNNPQRLRGFTQEEQAAMRAAAQTGVVSDALRVAGSRLGAIIAASSGGGIAAGGAAHVLSSVSRKTADALQTSKAQKLADLIANRGQVAPEPMIPVAEYMAQQRARQMAELLKKQGVSPIVAISTGKAYTEGNK